jgi:hypothetical protein
MHVSTSTNLAERFAQAPTFEQFLPTATENVDLWHKMWERAQVPEALIARVEALPGRWNLLVLSADWCGDASNTVPPVARLAERARNLDLRLLDRDENLDLMDEHLTNGTARSIPVVMVLDEDFREHSWWGPRPGALQEWVVTEGMALPKDERYLRIRRWYAQDKGMTTLEEIVLLLEDAAAMRRAA